MLDRKDLPVKLLKDFMALRLECEKFEAAHRQLIKADYGDRETLFINFTSIDPASKVRFFINSFRLQNNIKANTVVSVQWFPGTGKKNGPENTSMATYEVNDQLENWIKSVSSYTEIPATGL